jgi:hypothetical protein
MQIAYLAYNRLTPAVKDRADTLLKLNPDYAHWIAGAPVGMEKQYAFVHAATWADDIKTEPDYYDDRVTDSTAGQNVPYAHLKHSYWHYKDVLYSPDETTLPMPDPVDAVTQLKLMIAKLPGLSGASDDLRSYDLVWVLHLVGDLHQPLHAVGRYTAEISGPGGDRGGNLEMVTPATGETLPLHFYWDRMFGGYSSVFGAITDADDQNNGLKNVTADAAKALILDPDVWVQESFETCTQRTTWNSNMLAGDEPRSALPQQRRCGAAWQDLSPCISTEAHAVVASAFPLSGVSSETAIEAP